MVVIALNNFSLGSRIKELRGQYGYSQEQLALHAGITTAYLGMVERNEKNPTVLVVEKICLALGISLAEFFATEPTSPELDTLSLQILNRVRNRSEEEKRIILEIIQQVCQLREL